MALLATSSGGRASDSEQNAIPPIIASKRQNEDEHTPALVLTPPPISGILLAGHSSHSSHSSHYSSSGGGGGYSSPTPDYTPPAAPSQPPPTYAPAAPSPPPESPPPVAAQLTTSVLNKLAQLPSLWPKQVKLIERFGFTEIKDGVAVGVIGAPSGTVVDLIGVKGVKLIVSYLGNKAEIDAAITDIGDRVDSNAVISAPLLSSPPSPPASRTTSPAGTNTTPQTISHPSRSASVEAA